MSIISKQISNHIVRHAGTRATAKLHCWLVKVGRRWANRPKTDRRLHLLTLFSTQSLCLLQLLLLHHFLLIRIAIENKICLGWTWLPKIHIFVRLCRLIREHGLIRTTKTSIVLAQIRLVCTSFQMLFYSLHLILEDLHLHGKHLILSLKVWHLLRLEILCSWGNVGDLTRVIRFLVRYYIAVATLVFIHVDSQVCSFLIKLAPIFIRC